MEISKPGGYTGHLGRNVMATTINTATLANWTLWPISSITTMRRAGTIRPVSQHRVKKIGCRWSLPQCLALGLVRQLRQRGVRLGDYGAVLDWLSSLSRRDLEAEFASGRVALLVVGPRVACRLFHRGTI